MTYTPHTGFSSLFSQWRMILPALLLALLPLPAHALSLIRDAEIEETLKAYGAPLFEAAELTPSSIHIFIINDEAINAYVAGGSNLFIHTGLILEAPDPAMLIGVMAHETGHIAGGHLAQGAEKLKGAQLGTVLTTILGAAAVVGGGGKAGGAVIAAGHQTLMQNMLSFSRTNEQAADQAALSYLNDAHISASGLLRMFERLKREEDRKFGTPSAYARTHPLSRERIVHIRSTLDGSPVPRDTGAERFEKMHRRMLAKLYGFLKAPRQTLSRYPASNQSVEARYARAVAYYRIPELAKSLAEIDSLIKEQPSDPYFHELRGQILFENGKVAEALQSYTKAISLKPDATLIRVELAKAEIASGEQTLLVSAVKNLERATSEDGSNADAWRQLAIAYGKTNRLGMSYLALAEEAALKNQPDQIGAQVTQALKTLPERSPARLRAMDLRLTAKKMREDRD